jgi:hypothetical protein
MTDTAKPTPWDKVTDETLAVFHESGLTPRQLLEQRNELRDALMFYATADNYSKQLITEDCGCCAYYEDAPQIDEDCGDKARAALAKSGKVGG